MLDERQKDTRRYPPKKRWIIRLALALALALVFVLDVLLRYVRTEPRIERFP